MFSTVNAHKPIQTPAPKPLSPLSPKNSNIGPNLIMKEASPVKASSIKAKSLKRIRPTGTENQPPTKKQRRKTSTFEANLAPSRNDAKDLKEALLFHGGMRVQLFYITCLALWDKVEKFPGSPSKVKTKIGSAIKQSGVGTRFEHAAHSNAGAGLRDNLKEVYIGQIVRHGLTQKIEDVLTLAKKFSPDVIDSLKENHDDEELVTEVMNQNWPKQEPSLVDNEDLSNILNSTTKLPRAVNLQCDCPLERKIRPEMEKLYDQVLINKLTPEIAAFQYMDLIEAHFLEEIPLLEAKLKTLKDPDDINKCKNLLFYHETELEGTRIVDFSILRKDFETPQIAPTDIPCFDLSKTFDLFM